MSRFRRCGHSSLHAHPGSAASDRCHAGRPDGVRSGRPTTCASASRAALRETTMVTQGALSGAGTKRPAWPHTPAYGSARAPRDATAVEPFHVKLLLHRTSRSPDRPVGIRQLRMENRRQHSSTANESASSQTVSRHSRVTCRRRRRGPRKPGFGEEDIAAPKPTTQKPADPRAFRSAIECRISHVLTATLPPEPRSAYAPPPRIDTTRRGVTTRASRPRHPRACYAVRILDSTRIGAIEVSEGSPHEAGAFMRIGNA
ncbi:hypothetical protein J2X55_000486 [Microbacterium sp. 1154]|nr:hypothetical protein [Microbacterium sp. 1154]